MASGGQVSVKAFKPPKSNKFGAAKSLKQEKAPMKNEKGAASQRSKSVSHGKKSASADPSKRYPRTLGKAGKLRGGKAQGQSEKVVHHKTKKEERAAAKEKLLKRKKAKNNYEAILEMKRIWEELRRHRLPADKRRELCDRLKSLIGGKEKEFSKAHDTCRIVQCLYKFGDEAQRTAVFEGLKDTIVDMAKSKYSVFLVKKMLKVGTKTQKAFIIDAFMRDARRLLKHRIAGHMVEYIYNMFANSAQRAVFSRQFYGPALALTSTHLAGQDLGSKSEESSSDFTSASARQLGSLLTAEPHRREAVARHLKESLETMVRKEALAYTLVHELFLDYFQYATVGCDADRQAMAEVLQEHVPHFVHTREGARVGAYCIWYGTTKVRKTIIKSFKPHVEKMCADEFAPLVLFAAFDAVDDTQLVQKGILQTVMRTIGDLVNSPHGRKIMYYLLKPRDPAHFPREVADFLAQGDLNPVSKKESARRHAELLAFVSPPLLQYVVDNIVTLTADNASLLLVESVLLHAAGDLSSAMAALVQVLAAPFVANSGHLLENAACHIVMKKLIADDARKLQAGCLETGTMLKIGNEELSRRLKEILKPAVKVLRTKTYAGAKLLLQLLKA